MLWMLWMLSQEGKSLLMQGVEKGHTDVVRLLLLRGADPDKQDQDGWTALHFGAKENRVGVTAKPRETGLHDSPRVRAPGAWPAPRPPGA